MRELISPLTQLIALAGLIRGRVNISGRRPGTRYPDAA